MHRFKIRAFLLVIGFLTLTGCSGGASNDVSGDFDSRCTPVHAAVSSEKFNLIDRLSKAFQDSEQAKGLPTCANIIPMDVPSGEALRLLTEGWPEEQTEKSKPVIWSPASTSWTNQLAASQGTSLVENPVPFARSPLVFAMPEQMARTLGWPDKPVGYKELHDLCRDPQGWGRYGGSKALWGQFKLAKTNPTTSTSGLNTLLGQSYTAAGKRADLTEADVAASAAFSRDFESCVIHYGDTTGNVLDRLYQYDGGGLNYVSAIAVEETSVINYNLGNPTSKVVGPGEQLTPPQKKLVAVYPPEGSLESDNPLVVLGRDAHWITPDQRKAATAFQQFVVTPEAQKLLGDFGFRPIDPKAAPGRLITTENGVDPAQPAVRLPNPSPAVAAAAQQLWNNDIRKSSAVLVLVDTSKSMGDSAGTGRSRMEEAITSAQDTLDHFRVTDELGVWAFTTGISSHLGQNIAEIHPVEAGSRETLSRELENLSPTSGTPLYDVVATAYDYMKARAQPGRINAIVILSDGKDEGSRMRLDQLTLKLKSHPESQDIAPVRIFPIVYGQEASAEKLRQIAEATGGQVFDASDSRRINLVFRQVVNNF